MDPDPGREKLKKYNRKNERKSVIPVIVIFTSKFGTAPCFFILFSNLFSFFKLQKTLHTIIFTTFFELDSDPH